MKEREKKQLIAKYLPMLEAIAASVMETIPISHQRGMIEVEDLISEGFKGLIQALDKADATDPGLRSFLWLHIHGAMIDFLRRQGAYRRGQQRQGTLSLDMVTRDREGEEKSLGDLLLSPKTLEEQVLAEERWREAQHIIQDMTLQEQQFLLLHLERELPKKEIARLLGVSPTRVTQIHQRIIEKLQRAASEE